MKLIVSDSARAVLKEFFDKIAPVTPDPVAKVVYIDSAIYRDVSKSYWALAYYYGGQFPADWRVTVDGFDFIVEPEILPEGVDTINIDSVDGFPNVSLTLSRLG